MLNVIDEFTHEALAIRIDCKLNSTDVIDILSDLFSRLHSVPGYLSPQQFEDQHARLTVKSAA